MKHKKIILQLVIVLNCFYFIISYCVKIYFFDKLKENLMESETK